MKRKKREKKRERDLSILATSCSFIVRFFVTFRIHISHRWSIGSIDFIESSLIFLWNEKKNEPSIFDFRLDRYAFHSCANFEWIFIYLGTFSGRTYANFIIEINYASDLRNSHAVYQDPNPLSNFISFQPPALPPRPVN